jgi:hypothetical protein
MCEACPDSAYNTVGHSPLSYVGDGKPPAHSPYTKSMPRNSMGTGSSPTGKKVNRANVHMSERGGPKCTITATLYKPNAAESSAQLRNTRTLPSAAGVKDFFVERARQGQSF